ncbi:type II toxin-antitoxin system VapC family toxin [Rothia halotolerans]|uniref:type II toxin-antitoxin system VapC family toxin n=1 Tax=Rothia halotolerans TaxID=405770 RepID=UPI00101E1F92|nr:type II toxin-antitoxin system VapC family toxin [Rothia halotolerans]
MIVDTSAVIAIIRDEGDREAYVQALLDDSSPKMASPTYLECCIVIQRLGDPVAERRLEELLQALGVEVVPFTLPDAETARRAYRDFGKGTGHPAQLNYGDCISYATAVNRREPLLWKGEDFGHTGVAAALG